MVMTHSEISGNYIISRIVANNHSILNRCEVMFSLTGSIGTGVKLVPEQAATLYHQCPVTFLMESGVRNSCAKSQTHDINICLSHSEQRFPSSLSLLCLLCSATANYIFLSTHLIVWYAFLIFIYLEVSCSYS